MADPAAKYTIYLLTVWYGDAENAKDPALWRFRLENPRTKEHLGGVGTDALTDGLVNLVKHENDLFLVLKQPAAKPSDNRSSIGF